MDIGIDLGTTKVIACDPEQQIFITEPSVVAVDSRTGKIRAIGEEAYEMVGRTPSYINIVHPLRDGVVSDYKMTEVMIKHLLQKVTRSRMIRPRVALCVPCVTTGVEADAVMDSAAAAGARYVCLIEEPVAASIGAGIDISNPNGNMIVDIGGGTADIAVLSLNGIVCKTSLRVAGQEFDEVLIRYMKSTYNLLLGSRQAEELKIAVGCVDRNAEDKEYEVKGRDLVGGLPKRVTVTRKEIFPALHSVANEIVLAARGVLERTPPELVGDIYENGVALTGGGSMIKGLPELMTETLRCKTYLVNHPRECVAIGTAKAFSYVDKLSSGFIFPNDPNSNKFSSYGRF